MEDAPTPRIERQLFYEDMANLFGRGYSLSRADLVEIAPHYNYSVTSSGQIFGSENSETFQKAANRFSTLGVDLAVDRYRGRYIYFDESSKIDEDDRKATEANIDTSLSVSTDKNRRSREANMNKRYRP